MIRENEYGAGKHKNAMPSHDQIANVWRGNWITVHPRLLCWLDNKIFWAGYTTV